MAAFKLGDTVVTKGIADRMEADSLFRKFIYVSLGRYIRNDWGDTCEEDAKQNDESVESNERILAVYNVPGSADEKIWIITEWDRSVTTILFPEEY